MLTSVIVVVHVLVALLLVLLARTGRPAGRVVLYAWHPLAILETASSAHPEALFMLLVLAALLLWDRGRSARAGVALGAAVLTKFVPLVLAPMLARRLRWRFALAGAATIGLLYLPYLSAGRELFSAFGTYADESFGAGPYRSVRDAVAAPHRRGRRRVRCGDIRCSERPGAPRPGRGRGRRAWRGSRRGR